MTDANFIEEPEIKGVLYDLADFINNSLNEWREERAAKSVRWVKLRDKCEFNVPSIAPLAIEFKYRSGTPKVELRPNPANYVDSCICYLPFHITKTGENTFVATK
jgi:hypothetical protein